MREEETQLARLQNQCNQLTWSLVVPLQIEGAHLRNVELKIISECTIEIWIQTAFLELFDCVTMVHVESNELLDDSHLLLLRG